MTGFELVILIIAWMVAAGSPGPATLAISGTSMAHGRRSGLIIASGIMAGSASWGIAAGLGLSALMLANIWLFEIVRYLGAAYLLYLAVKSLRSAFSANSKMNASAKSGNLFVKGMLLHLTNPKAVLGWGSVYAIALPPGAPVADIAQLFAILIMASACVFWGYALIFSSRAIADYYIKMRRWFELAFAALFGAASIRIFTSRIEV